VSGLNYIVQLNNVSDVSDLQCSVLWWCCRREYEASKVRLFLFT